MTAVLGFDSSVLSPFARAGRLDVLDRLTAGHRRIVTRAVLDELERGRAQFPRLVDATAAAWLEVVAVDSLDELTCFVGPGRFGHTAMTNPSEAL